MTFCISNNSQYSGWVKLSSPNPYPNLQIFQQRSNCVFPAASLKIYHFGLWLDATSEEFYHQQYAMEHSLFILLVDVGSKRKEKRYNHFMAPSVRMAQ